MMIFKQIKFYSIFILLSTTSSFLWGQTRCDSIKARILTKEDNYVLVASHRGHWRHSTENSMSAIQHAIKIGVDIIEIDIQRTKDGHLILMHDETLDRTTTGKGRVDSVQLEYVKSLHLRNGIGVATKERVPTLKEVLEANKGSVLFNLDKADRFIDDVYALLRQTGTTKMVIMKSDKPFTDIRVQFHEYLFESLLMPIVNLDQPHAINDIVSYVNFLKPKLIELTFENPLNDLPKRMSNELNEKTVLWYNTMWEELSGGLSDDVALDNPDLVYGYLIDSLKAKVIHTDRPVYLLDYLRKRNLHN